MRFDRQLPRRSSSLALAPVARTLLVPSDPELPGVGSSSAYGPLGQRSHVPMVMPLAEGGSSIGRPIALGIEAFRASRAVRRGFRRVPCGDGHRHPIVPPGFELAMPRESATVTNCSAKRAGLSLSRVRRRKCAAGGLPPSHWAPAFRRGSTSPAAVTSSRRRRPRSRRGTSLADGALPRDARRIAVRPFRDGDEVGFLVEEHAAGSHAATIRRRACGLSGSHSVTSAVTDRTRSAGLRR